MMNNPNNQQVFGYTPMPPPNPINGAQGFDSAFASTLPNEKVVIPTHTFVIDSRQRDCKIYPSPSFYRINFGDVFKNVTSLELRGATIPRTSYNVHSTNNNIDFIIGSSITEIKLINGGSRYTVAPTVTVPAPKVGVQAIVTAVINLGTGSVTSFIIVNPGSGYSPSRPPIISIEAPINGSVAKGKAVVGTSHTAELREGQYAIGGNPTPPGVSPSGLILEVQNAMNYAANYPAPYNPVSVGPFEVRLVSQYPELGADPGTPEAFDTNSSLFNRIQITNTDSVYWELPFCSGPNKQRNANNLLGFTWVDQINPYLTPAVISPGGVLISEGTTYRAEFDYDLLDDPDFVSLSFWTGNQTFERIQSSEPSLDRKFGIMIFDANGTDVIKDTTGATVTPIGGIDFLEGPVTKGTFYKDPGVLKALKGFDFDQKKVVFAPALGKFTSLTIQMTKFGTQNGGSPYVYNTNRNHVLVFSISMSDLKNNSISA